MRYCPGTLHWVLVWGLILVGEGLAKNPPAANPAIQQRMQDFVRQGRAAGVVTLVARDGEIVHLDAVGQADVAADRPMRTDSMFAIASMTKPITATALMILVDEGKLALDDPLAKYIPEFAEVQLADASPQRPPTVRDALTHTAGLVGSQRTLATLAETAQEIAGRPLGYQPGAKWQYSPGLTVCGRVIEVASGMPYAEFVQKRIFAPLQMNDTTFSPSAEQRARIATLYKPGKESGTLAPADHWLTGDAGERAPNPSGGLFSTARDLFRFYQAILNGGQLGDTRIVSAKAVAEMTRLQTGELTTGFTPGNGWGLGWCIVRKPQDITTALSPGSFGHGGAFGTQGWVDPKRKMVYVLLIQRTKFGNSDGSQIRKAFQDTALEVVGP